MIFLRLLGSKAQSTIEFMVAASVLLLTSFVGVGILFYGSAVIFVTHYAANHCRCLILETNPYFCEQQTKRALQTHFAFRDIKIHTKKVRQIIHTEIKTRQFNSWIIRGSYDLEPSEYKRVAHGP